MRADNVWYSISVKAETVCPRRAVESLDRKRINHVSFSGVIRDPECDRSYTARLNAFDVPNRYSRGGWTGGNETDCNQKENGDWRMAIKTAPAIMGFVLTQSPA